MFMCFPLPGCVRFRRLHVLHLQMMWATSSADVKQHQRLQSNLHPLLLQHSLRLEAVGPGGVG